MKTVSVYHSIDLDGRMSAAIVKYWHFTKPNEKINGGYRGTTLPIDDIDFLGYNHGEPIPDLSGYDQVIDLRKIEIPKEEWKTINEYDGKFSISNWGRLKSNNYTVKNNSGYREVNGKILSQHINSNYPSVVTNYGKLYIHQLVAKFFINNTENKLTVNHKDGVKTNNLINNLEWNTHKENQQHSILNGLRKIGINNKRNIPIIKIKNEIEIKYPSLTIAAIENNLHSSNIARALKDGTKCGGFNWKYDTEISVEHTCREIINIGSIISSCKVDNLSILEMIWKYFFPDEPIPEIVRLLGMYDSFRYKGTDEETKVLEFQYGARGYITNYEEAYEYLLKDLKNNLARTDVYNTGRIIYSYLCEEAKQTYKNGFEILLVEPKNNTTVGEQVKRFLVINKERFNPINLGIDYHKDGYDGCACFHYDGTAKLWRFSLYNDNELVDCSAIAKQFGGGGHKEAAGFVLNNEQFNKLMIKL